MFEITVKRDSQSCWSAYLSSPSGRVLGITGHGTTRARALRNLARDLGFLAKCASDMAHNCPRDQTDAC